jgi:Holliday junction resolvasome RuvABC endonuclease subunit
MGLDLSCTATGIAVLGGDGAVLHLETVGYALKKGTVREKVERLMHIADRILRVRDQYDVRDVAVENYSYGARGAQNDLGELGGVVKVQLWLRNQIEVRVVQVNSARKEALGAGNIKKVDVPRLVAARGVPLGFLPVKRGRTVAERDPDQADAWVVAEWLRLQVV